MKKVVIKQVQQTIHVCDVCEETDLGPSPRHCWICARQACWKCLKFKFLVKPGDLVDFGISVCEDCLKHEELVDRIQAILDGANAGLREWVDLWRKAVKVEEQNP